ncbi:MAG: hypothetical protein KatS3mg108_1152 [Isosphaeraceae bacterium]|nr:MAG: hypothetical protein KatS3mg108_1152 [Isosphaeraceae bacterium]
MAIASDLRVSPERTFVKLAGAADVSQVLRTVSSRSP